MQEDHLARSIDTPERATNVIAYDQSVSNVVLLCIEVSHINKLDNVPKRMTITFLLQKTPKSAKRARDPANKTQAITALCSATPELCSLLSGNESTNVIIKNRLFSQSA